MRSDKEERSRKIKTEQCPLSLAEEGYLRSSLKESHWRGQEEEDCAVSRAMASCI